jgi:hypothetical protein
MFKRLSVLAAIMPVLIINFLADSAVQPKDIVNWTNGAIVSYGMYRVTLNEGGTPVDEDSGSAISLNRGRTASYRKAREQAFESMSRLVRGIRVDADTMMTDLLEESDIVQSRIVNIMRSRIKLSFFPVDFYTSGCRAELKIGDLLPAVPYKYQVDDFPARIDNPIPTDYTSLIVDVRGLGIEPMILPSIFNESGLEVFGRHYIDIRHATRFGIVSYAFSENDAMKSPRAGDHPYYTVAVGGLKGCPVLSNRDIRKIFSSNRTLEYLKKCRVIFIIDKTTK